jgi:hypothetical protein
VIPFTSLSLSELLDEKLIAPNNEGKFNLYDIELEPEFTYHPEGWSRKSQLQFQIAQQLQDEEL